MRAPAPTRCPLSWPSLPHPHAPSPPTASTPGLKITEVASKIGELWKGLSEGEKNKYKAHAERLKVQFAAGPGVRSIFIA